MSDDMRKSVLDAYFDGETDSGRFTSQDVCDNLRETLRRDPDEVTEYLLGEGWSLSRQFDRLVWVKS